MGRIKTSEIKRTAFNLIRAYSNAFTHDFEKNKAVLNELKIVIESKRDRNEVAGYITHLMKARKAAS